MNQNREEILFQLVLTKSSAERVSWLDRECGDDKSLRLRLDALLAAHDQPDELLEGDGIEKTKVMETIKVELTDELTDEAVRQTLSGVYASETRSRSRLFQASSATRTFLAAESASKGGRGGLGFSMALMSGPIA